MCISKNINKGIEKYFIGMKTRTEKYEMKIFNSQAVFHSPF